MALIAFFKTLWRAIMVMRLLWRAHSSKQVPIPLLGQLDDASLLALLGYIVYQLLPKAFLAAQGWVRNRPKRAARTVIEGDYREVR